MKSYTALDFLNADISITRLVNIYHNKTTEWSRPKKIMRENEGLLFFISGGIEYDFGSFGFKALPGQIVRLPSGIPYNGCKLDDDPNHFYCVDFITATPGEFEKFPLPFSFMPTDKDSVIKNFAALEERFRNHSLSYKLDCKNQLGTLLSMLAKDYAVNQCRFDNRSRIMQYSEYLRENAGRCDLRVSELSDKFHISETHMRRIFTTELVISPSEYLSRSRIENAKILLTTQHNLTVEQISAACGYSSVYYFSSAFRQAVGCSPTKFKDLWKQT